MNKILYILTSIILVFSMIGAYDNLVHSNFLLGYILASPMVMIIIISLINDLKSSR